MLKSTRWFAKELERRDRLHAQQLDAERAAWRQERRTLIETVCTLAGKPVYDLPEPEPADDDVYGLTDASQRPAEPVYAGDGLLSYQPEE